MVNYRDISSGKKLMVGADGDSSQFSGPSLSLGQMLLLGCKNLVVYPTSSKCFLAGFWDKIFCLFLSHSRTGYYQCNILGPSSVLWVRAFAAPLVAMGLCLRPCSEEFLGLSTTGDYWFFLLTAWLVVGHRAFFSSLKRRQVLLLSLLQNRWLASNFPPQITDLFWVISSSCLRLLHHIMEKFKTWARFCAHVPLRVVLSCPVPSLEYPVEAYEKEMESECILPLGLEYPKVLNFCG